MKNKTLKYILLVVLVIAVIAAAFFVVRSMLNVNKRVSGGEYVSQRFRELDEPVPAPDIAFQDFDGKVHNLSDFRGSKVIINFWAVYCPPCVEELPDFDKSVGPLEDENTVILAINIAESQADIEKFLRSNNIDDLGVYMDIDSNAAATYGIQVIPSTLVIDSKGYVRATARGAVTDEDLMYISGQYD